MKAEAKEVKINAGYSGSPKNDVKEFTFGELDGLRQVFNRLEASNIKRSGKVDYWLSKNQRAIGKSWENYMKTEWDLLKNYAVIEEINGVEYLLHKGADENDIMYFSGGAMYKKVDGKLELTFKPFWKLEIPATEEGAEPTFQDMEYRIKYQTETAQEEFNAALAKMREEYKTAVDLWTLSEEHLEGLNVVWKDIKTGQDGKAYVESDATVFRNLLYDYCIQ